jgi:hypothetical protein
MSSANRLPEGERSDCCYDWEIQFFFKTNLLARVPICGDMFLSEGGEFTDNTGELERLDDETCRMPLTKIAAKHNKKEILHLADMVAEKAGFKPAEYGRDVEYRTLDEKQYYWFVFYSRLKKLPKLDGISDDFHVLVNDRTGEARLSQ